MAYSKKVLSLWRKSPKVSAINAVYVSIYSSKSKSVLASVLQTIQTKLTLLWVWAGQAVLGRAKTALKFKYEI